MADPPFSFDQQLRDQLFKTLIEQSPVAMALFYGPRFVIALANESVLLYWGRTRDQVINKPLFEALPEAKEQGYEELLTGVFTTGERFVAKELTVLIERNQQLERTYIDFVYEPFYDSDSTIIGVTVVCTEVTQQVLARMGLEESERNLRHMILQSPTAMCIYKGPHHVVETANERMIEFWGRPATDVMGKPMFEGLPEAKGQGYEALLDHVFTTGEPYSAQSIPVNLPRAGTIKTNYVNLLYTPYREADGHISGVMAVAVDVSDQVRAQQETEISEVHYRNLSTELEQQVQQNTQELAAYNEELVANNEELAAINEEYISINEELGETNQLLVRSNKNLQQFAYVASHDLQEPLRKIQQFGDLLRTQYAASTDQDLLYLDRMQLAASRMSILIRDLLNYSRIGTRNNLTILVSLDRIVDRALSTLELVISETNAQVSFGLLPIIWGDETQLEQLFQNLLSNALKFHHPNAVPVIRIDSQTIQHTELPPSVSPARAASAYHRIDVVDNGVGFEEKYLDRIFQVFQRLHGKNEFAGTGIGLAICEKVVANHGGAITATSQPAQGATFSVYIPIKPSSSVL